MDDESKFWVSIWRIAGVTLVCLASVAAGCTAHRNQSIKKMVDGGADPLRAACALGVSERDLAVCAVLATKGQ